MEFNESLKRLLIEKNMKQADLCRLAHIQTSLMSEYINGKKSPTIGNAIQIADALDISLDVLAGREERVRYSESVPNVYVDVYKRQASACPQTHSVPPPAAWLCRPVCQMR